MNFVIFVENIEMTIMVIANLVLATIDYFDKHQGLLTILGWFAIFIFGLRQQRKALADEAKMKVYEELSLLKQDFDRSFSINFVVSVGSSISFTFLAIKGSGGLAYPRKDYEYWLDYVGKLQQEWDLAFADFSRFHDKATTWMNVMPDLERAGKILYKEFIGLMEDVNAHTLWLRRQQASSLGLWEKDAEERAKKLTEKIDQFTNLMEDFLNLVHNEIITPIFSYKRKKDFSHIQREFNYKILTKSGIVECVHRPGKKS